jgi:drug/metabolite transporter (DMT)-like permease
MTQRRASPAVAYTLLTLASLFWAGNTIVGRAISTLVPPIGLAFWRWVLASAVLLPFAFASLRRDGPVLWRHRWYVLVVSALGVCAFNTLLYTGLRDTTAINASVILATMPVLIVLSSFLLYRTPVTGREAAGIALCLVGALAIAAHGQFLGLLSLEFGRGDLLVLIASVSYGLYGAALRSRPEVGRLSFLAATFVVGTALHTPLYAIEIASGAVVPITPESLAAIAYVGVFPSILSYFFFNYGVEIVGANRAGLFFNLVPVFVAALAIVLLREAIAPYHWVGGGAIALGLFLATHSTSRR